MNLTQSSTAALVCCLFSACGSTGGTEETQTTATANTASDKKICRSYSELGSHMKKTVCRTQAEWDMIERQGGDDMDALLSGPATTTIPSTGN